MTMKSILALVCTLFALATAQLDLGIDLGGIVNIGGILYGDTCAIISGGLWSSPTCWQGGVLPNLEGSASVTVNSDVSLTCDKDVEVGYLTYGQASTHVNDYRKFTVHRCDWRSGEFSLGSNAEYTIAESATVYPSSSNSHFRSNGYGKVKVNSGASVGVASNANLYATGVQFNGGSYQISDYGRLHAESCAVTAPTYFKGSSYAKAKVSGNTNVDSNLYLHSHADQEAGSTVNLRGYGAVEVANNANWNLYGCTVAQGGSGSIVKVGNDAGSYGKVIVKPHATPTKFRGGYVDVRSNGEVHVEANAVASVEADTEFSGNGYTHVKGSCESRAPYKVNNKVKVYPSGQLHVRDSGYVHIGSGGQPGEVEVNSGKCRTTSASTHSHYVVGAASGAASYLKFKGSEAAPCEVHGGNYEAKETGNIDIDTYGKTVIKAASKFRGAGKVNVKGHLDADAPFSCEAPLNVRETGKVTFNAANQHTVKSLAYASSTSHTVIKASSTGFKPVKVTESAAYKGKLTVDAGSYAPTSRVTLVDCANGSGAYDNVEVVTTTAAKGKVVYDAGKVCYEPL